MLVTMQKMDRDEEDGLNLGEKNMLNISIHVHTLIDFTWSMEVHGKIGAHVEEISLVECQRTGTQTALTC